LPARTGKVREFNVVWKVVTLYLNKNVMMMVKLITT